MRGRERGGRERERGAEGRKGREGEKMRGEGESLEQTERRERGRERG